MDGEPKESPMLKTCASLVLFLFAIPMGAQAAHYRHLSGHFLNDLSATPGKVNAEADATKVCIKGYTS